MPGESLLITGQVFSGLGEGRFITELDWVQSQCRSKLGFAPVPGTFNLRVVKEDLVKVARLDGRRGIKILPPSAMFVVGKCFLVEVGGVRGALVRPMLEDYPPDVVEIIAPVNLRDTLKVADGDVVEVKVLLDAGACSATATDGEGLGR